MEAYTIWLIQFQTFSMAVGFVHHYMEALMSIYTKTSWIFHYINDTFDYDLYYSPLTIFELLDIMIVIKVETRIYDTKRTNSFMILMGNTIFTWTSKKPPMWNFQPMTWNLCWHHVYVGHKIWLKKNCWWNLIYCTRNQ